MARIHCQCGARLNLPAFAAGRLAKCDACGRLLCAVAGDGARASDDFNCAVAIEAGPENVGRQYFLGGDAEITIGKDARRQICLPGAKVSRLHCQLVRTGAGWRAEDQGSTNGLFVNGERAEARDLRHGDRLTLGEYRLVFLVGDVPSAEPGQRAVAGGAYADFQPQPAASPALPGTRAGAQPSLGERVCPSCQEQLAAGATICVRCGIHAGSGRPVLTARGVDEDMLQARSEKAIRPLSWLIPFGIYPIYSEARGKSKPYATWAIVALTCLVSTWFWVHELSGSTTMRSMKNLMLWSGQVEPDADHIIYFYNATAYGDVDAFVRKRDELAGTVPEDELDVAAHKALTGEQQSVGQYRHSQLITHALLHGGIFHLAGNLLFLLVFGSRVNAAIGNIATAILYPVLAVVAGLAHAASSAGQMPVPMLGASGAIMGMAGMYLVLFPLHKVHIVIWMRWGLIAGFRLSRKFFALRGVIVVMFYIAFDIVYTAMGLESGTAHWAHLGGFICGIVLAVVLLAARMVYSGGDLLSMVLGKYAWPLIGSPSERAQSRAPLDQTMMMPPDQR